MTHSQFPYNWNFSTNKTGIFISKALKRVYALFFSGLCEQRDSLQVTGRQKWVPLKNKAYKLEQVGAVPHHTWHGMHPYAWHRMHTWHSDFSSKTNNITLFAPESISWNGRSRERSVRWAAQHSDRLWDQKSSRWEELVRPPFPLRSLPHWQVGLKLMTIFLIQRCR